MADIVIKSGQAFRVVSTSKCGRQTLLRPTEMPIRAVVTTIAAKKLTDIAETMKAALAERSTVEEPKAPPAPTNPSGPAIKRSTLACSVGSYGPRHLVRQSLRRLIG